MKNNVRKTSGFKRKETFSKMGNHAISVNTRNEEKRIREHIPDVLSEMVFKFLSEWKVLNITAKITRRHCRVPEEN